MLIDPDDPPEVQIARQGKIIDALVRRANREKDVGPSAFRAFQSAIELQQEVQAHRRDLARAETTIRSIRDEQERMRRNLVEALSSMEDGFALFTEGRLALCNDPFRRLLRHMSEQIDTGVDIKRFFAQIAASNRVRSSDRNLATLTTTLDARRDGSSVSVMIELQSDRWFQLNAQWSSSENVVLLLTDVTRLVRRNRSEKKSLIDRQEDYLQAVFQNMSAGVCSFSAAGEVTMHNARFREILRLPRALLEEGCTARALILDLRRRGEFSDDALARIEDWQHDLERQGMIDTRVGRAPDRVLHIQVHEMPDRGFLVEVKDVTFEARTTEMLENRVMARTAELTKANEQLVREYEEKARIEEALRQAKERAEAAVSSKTRFLAAASHDLLQPINAAKLLISTLLETTRGTPNARLVERLEGSFRSTEHLLHSLLDISRLESAEPDTITPTNVSLGGIIGNVHADQTVVAEEKGVRLDVVPSSVFVRSDPVYLFRSIQNLVVNALQYTGPGGRVLVGCRRRGGQVRLEVWDTGIGISLRDQGRIFEEFARAEDQPIGSGMGLGLSVVDRACRLLGHELTLRSKPGVGSVFSIGMDVVEGVSSRAEPAWLLQQSEALLTDHVTMVIENDEDVLYSTTQWLEQWGAEVLSVRSTAEAMAVVRDRGMPPDIILADYQLEGDDTGVAAIAGIRELAGEDIPAIIITANRSDSLGDAGIQPDVPVMSKPVKLARLRPLIAWKVARRRREADKTATKVSGEAGATNAILELGRHDR